MSFWILLQVIIDLFVVAGLVGVWLKKSRASKEDPRLSKGLQLLQTKISVLEDLSDRTETQVTQLTALLEGKVKELQTHILQADKQLQKIDAATGKSLEVAKIFQDRIPHQEIIERQNTIKYVTAARLAHQGLSIEEIMQQVDLARGEIEFIAKVNRETLQFSEEDLPDWANEVATPPVAGASPTMEHRTALPNLSFVEQDLVTPKPLATAEDRVSLSDLGDRFRKAIDESVDAMAVSSIPEIVPPAPASVGTVKVTTVNSKTVAAAPASETQSARNSKGETIQVKKVVFPRVDAGKGLLG